VPVKYLENNIRTKTGEQPPWISLKRLVKTEVDNDNDGDIDLGTDFTYDENGNIWMMEGWVKMTLVDTKVGLEILKTEVSAWKGFQSNLHEGASRGSSKAGRRRWTQQYRRWGEGYRFSLYHTVLGQGEQEGKLKEVESSRGRLPRWRWSLPGEA